MVHAREVFPFICFLLTGKVIQYNLTHLGKRKMHRLQHQVINSVGNIHLERKLAAKLWKLARDFGIDTEEGVVVDMSISVTFLADMLGTPRETASRLVRDLTQYGLIRHDKKRVLVCDMDRLAHFFKTGIYEE